MAAGESQIAEAEKAVNFDLPGEFRALLSVINGWKGFYMGVDLFGTDDFISGRSLQVKQRDEIAEFLDEAGFSAVEALVIAHPTRKSIRSS